MKLRFLGTDACPDQITIRDMTFDKGKSVEVDGYTATKCAALPYFEEVKPGRKKKTDDQNLH